LVTAALIHFFIFANKAPDHQQLSVFAGFVASYFGVLFFVQKHKLEQDQFVKELFVLFNGRYDHLRAALDSALKTNGLDEQQRLTLQRYFNLCAEEYFFWKSGRIPTVVWQSWRCGMDTYISVPVIRVYAEKEVRDQSYYGLATELRLREMDHVD